MKTLIQSLSEKYPPLTNEQFNQVVDYYTKHRDSAPELYDRLLDGFYKDHIEGNTWSTNLSYKTAR